MNFAYLAILSRANVSYGTLYNSGKCSSLAKVGGWSLVSSIDILEKGIKGRLMEKES